MSKHVNLMCAAMSSKIGLLLILVVSPTVRSECPTQCSHCCQRDGRPCGDVIVDSCERLFFNETVNITCQLDANFTEFDSSSLYFSPNSSNDDILIADERTIILPYTITSNTAREVIYCDSRMEKRTIQRIQFLYLDYYPQEVVNFSCVIEGRTRNLSCTWDHPVTYRFLDSIKVTFEWKSTFPFEGILNQCPSAFDTASCDGFSSSVFEVLFRINVTNTKRNVTTATSIKQSMPYEVYWKPRELTGIRVTNITKSSIALVWPSDIELLQYTIKYISDSGSKHHTCDVMNKTSPCSIADDKKNFAYSVSVVLSNLSTYEFYRVEVTARYCSGMNQNHCTAIGKPTNPLIITAYTSQDVARYPPATTIGGYTQHYSDGNTRNVTVYWKYMENMETNGPIEWYYLTLNDSAGRQISVSNISKTHYRYMFTDVPLNTDLEVYIRAGTVMGMSEDSQPIKITSGVTKPPVMVIEKVSTNTERYNISWTVANLSDVRTFTVFWSNKHNRHQDKIDWVTIQANQTYYVVEGMNKTDHIFGVSMETEISSSGFNWESCYYVRDKDPKAPESIQIQSKDKSSITLAWNRPRCGELSPFIQYYLIAYCILDGKKTCKSKSELSKIITSVSSIYMTYKMNDLEPGSAYKIEIEAVTSAGKHSPVKTINAILPNTIDPASGRTVGVVTGAVFGCFSIFVVVILIVYNRQELKKCLKPHFSIDTIEISVKTESVNSTTVQNDIENSSTDQNKLTPDSWHLEDEGYHSCYRSNSEESEDAVQEDLLPEKSCDQVEEELEPEQRSTFECMINDLTTHEANSAGYVMSPTQVSVKSNISSGIETCSSFDEYTKVPIPYEQPPSNVNSGYLSSNEVRLLSNNEMIDSSENRLLSGDELEYSSEFRLLLEDELKYPSESRLLSSDELEYPSESRLLSIDELEDPSESRLLSSDELEDPSESRLLSSDELEDPSESRLLSSDEPEDPNESRLLSSDELEDPSESRLLSSDELEDPSESRLLSSDELEDPSESRLLSSDELEDPSESRLLSIHELENPSEIRLVSSNGYTTLPLIGV